MKQEYLDRLNNYFEFNGIDVTGLTTKEKLKKMKEIIFDKKVELDLLEIDYDGKNENVSSINYVAKVNAINIEIHDAIICKNLVRLVKKEERKDRILNLFKKKNR